MFAVHAFMRTIWSLLGHYRPRVDSPSKVASGGSLPNDSGIVSDEQARSSGSSRTTR